MIIHVMSNFSLTKDKRENVTFSVIRYSDKVQIARRYFSELIYTIYRKQRIWNALCLASFLSWLAIT